MRIKTDQEARGKLCDTQYGPFKKLLTQSRQCAAAVKNVFRQTNGTEAAALISYNHATSPTSLFLMKHLHAGT